MFEELASIHTVEVLSLTLTQQPDGTKPRIPNVVERTISCRVRPLSASRRVESGRDTDRKTHIVYFSENPELQEGQYLRWTASNGGTEILRTLGIPINDHNLDCQYHVNCESTTLDTPRTDYGE